MSKILNDNFIKEFNTLLDSNDPRAKIFSATLLKELGKIGQHLYKLNPNSEIKKGIMKIYNHLKSL